jgi:hypothetical protein
LLARGSSGSRVLQLLAAQLDDFRRGRVIEIGVDAYNLLLGG